MRLSAIVPVLLFPAFGVVAGAEYDNRPEALLAGMDTALAEPVVLPLSDEEQAVVTFLKSLAPDRLALLLGKV